MITNAESTLYLHRPCPCCGAASDHATLGVASPRPAERRPFGDLADRWHGIFKEKSFFTYKRCTTCGLLYNEEYFDSDQLSQLYGAMPENMSDVPASALSRTQRGYFREFERHAKLSGDLLEIGPDNGLFVEHCVRDGGFSQYWMFEPNIDVHGALRERLAGTTHRIVSSMFDLSDVPDGSISAAVMIHVLDHLTTPVTFLEAVREKMTSTGTLLIVTHDERSFLARLMGHRWPAYCLQHPHLFNRSSIREMLKRAGFTVAGTYPSTNHFPVTYLMQHVAFALGMNVKVPMLESLQIGLKLGNMITIARPSDSAS